MKKFLMIACLFFYSGLIDAQSSKVYVPTAVNKACKEKYPSVKEVKWQKDKDAYAALFYFRGAPCTARFNEKGDWLDETRKTSFGELRNNVRNAFSKSKFAAWRAYEVNEITERNKEPQYRILISNTENQSQRYIFYDTKGQLTKEISM